MNEWLFIVSLVSLLIGMLTGALFGAFWLSRRKTRKKLVQPLPGFWPLRGRAILSSHEHNAWHSLRSVFHDHAVLVKIPILRFTQLLEPSTLELANTADVQNGRKPKSDQWLEMLGGLYATFTICTLEGNVVGCVDVFGKHEDSKANREMKEALLLDCGIAYIVTSAFNVPDASTLRELFLGERPDVPEVVHITRGGDSDFHAEMNVFTTVPAILTG